MNATPTGYRPGFVTLDSAPIPAFLPTDDRTWNGFAMPIFDPAVLAEHRETLASIFPVDNGNPDALILTWDGDRPVVTDPEYPGDYVRDVVIDGVGFLDIGNGGFVWSEADDEDEDA